MPDALLHRCGEAEGRAQGRTHRRPLLTSWAGPIRGRRVCGGAPSVFERGPSRTLNPPCAHPPAVQCGEAPRRGRPVVGRALPGCRPAPAAGRVVAGVVLFELRVVVFVRPIGGGRAPGERKGPGKDAPPGSTRVGTGPGRRAGARGPTRRCFAAGAGEAERRPHQVVTRSVRPPPAPGSRPGGPLCTHLLNPGPAPTRSQAPPRATAPPAPCAAPLQRVLRPPPPVLHRHRVNGVREGIFAAFCATGPFGRRPAGR